jgi:hypothetical protein
LFHVLETLRQTGYTGVVADSRSAKENEEFVMKKTCVMLCAVFCALMSSSGFAADADGWVNLFNGKDLDGWEQKGGEAKYAVTDGAIVGTSVPDTGNSFLCSRNTYGDFVLEFEYMGHPALNSGVQIRSNSLPDYKDGQVHGYQCELEDEGQDRDWSGGIYDEGRRGWLFPKKEDKEACARFSEQGKKVYKNGEWNQIRIEARGDRIQTWVNGEVRADLRDDMTPKGFIGLQVHGVKGKKEPMSIRWRNIRIKELK